MTISPRITKHTPIILKLGYSNARSSVYLLIVILAVIQSVPLLLGGFVFILRPQRVQAKLECTRDSAREISCELSQTETSFFSSNTQIVTLEDIKEAKLKVKVSRSSSKSETTRNYSIILLDGKSEIPFINGKEIEFGVNETTQEINKINAFIGDPRQEKLTVYRQNNPILLQIFGVFIIILAWIALGLLISDLSKSFNITFDKSVGIITITSKRIGKVQEKQFNLSRVESICDIKISKSEIINIKSIKSIKNLKKLEPLQPLDNIALDSDIDSGNRKKQYYYIVALVLKSGQHLFLFNSSRPFTSEVDRINKFLGVSQN